MKHLVQTLLSSSAALALGVGLALGAGLLQTPALAAAQTGPNVTGPTAAEASSTATGAYLAGRHAQQVDDWTSAAAFMERALAHDPGNVALLRRTFLLQLGDGRASQAVELARRLAQKDPTNHLAATVLAADDLLRDKPKQAEKRLVGAVSEDGLGQYVTPLLNAWIEYANGRPAEGVKALEPLSATPGFAALHDLQAALILDLAGRRDEAAARYAKASESGASLRVVQLYGNFLERQGRKDEARRLYTQFGDAAADPVLIEPSLSALGSVQPAGGQAGSGQAAGAQPGGGVKPLVGSAREGMAEALFDLSSALHQEGASELALLYGRVALLLRPDFPLARLMTADILSSRKRYDEAIAEYRQIGGDRGVRWLARMRTAEQFQLLKREDEAIRLLEELGAERPERTDALVGLGDLHRSAQRFDKAAEAYDRAIARLGSDLGSRSWAIFYARGIALERSQQWERAEADLKKALELSPEQPYVLNYLGYSWVDRGQNLDEAKRMILRAVELKPDDGYIVDSLGWVLYRLGDVQGAVGHLERAIELKPQDATINDHLGDAYWQIGRRTEARFQWERALLNAAEDDKLKAEIREKLAGGLPQRGQRHAETQPAR
ncbi:tetratricopeptide repeat protein [Arenibaculum pallidiluteum]|uniref:tetratricopeptide repeat protein n=1 Tax=Arenibaculum pallidiluteum TaxID=2812559 RepID=UPI001A97907A|nr:tetratricopeptide repeat protein [Arenibaculum pallidiluteum]